MITVDMNKAKIIGHNIRRELREMEFEPHDKLIMKQIPGVDVVAIESARQEIRERYAQIQTQIDVSETPEEIKNALGI